MTEPSATTQPWQAWKWYLLSIVVAAVLLLISLWWNFGYDQGTFAYGGSALLKGARPYLDFWDIKPPNIFYIYAAAFAVFGERVFSIRLLDYLNALLTVSLLWLLLTEAWKDEPWKYPAAFFASLAFVTEYLIQGWQDTAQAETYSLPLLLGAMLLVLGSHTSIIRSRSVRAALAGILIAVAFYFKFTNGIFLVPCGVAVLMHDRADRLRGVVCLATGFIVGIALQSGVLAMQGELSELWKITTGSTIKYSQSNFSGNFSILHNLRTTISILDPLWIVAALVGWIAIARNKWLNKTSSENAMLFILAILVGLAVIQLQNKGYKYHYQIILVWSAALIGAGCGAVIEVAKLRTRLSPMLGTLFLAPLLFVGSCYTSNAQMPGVGLLSKQPEITRVGNRLAKYAEMHSGPNDKIFIFGFDPYVYWKSNRAPANRFLNTIHFKPSYVAPELRTELVASLTNKPPKLMFIEMGDHYTSQGDSFDDSRTTISKRYPEIEQLLATRFGVPDTLDDVLAYRLR